MAAINPKGAPQFGEGSQNLTVRVPIAEPPGKWLGEYLALARREGIAAEALNEPDGVRLRIRLALDCGRDDIFATLDAALRLVDQAKAEVRSKSTSAAYAQQHVMDWWTQRCGAEAGASSGDGNDRRS